MLTVDGEPLRTDVLILGGGGAALCAALHLTERAPDLDVTVAVKGLLAKSGCTRMVQGGYNAVLNPADSFERHFADTIQGGAFLNEQDLAWLLVTRAPAMIAELEARYGCFFDRGPDGAIHQKPFGGQSFDRTVHRGDLTGIEIMERLRDALLGRRVRVLEEHRGVGLLADRRGVRVCGAVLLDARGGRFLRVAAAATLLATGGGPTMYAVSSPSREKSADGVAMAYAAGAELMDMEMVQFHPTGLMVEGSELHGAVLEEGLRGVGGRLFNALGERFMARYDPVRLERATRDLVSRACYLEAREGRGSPLGGVWLDLTHLAADEIEAAFPGMVERTRAAGYDLARGRVEISPTAHFLMGGARIDARCRTTLPGLYAAGEDAAGVQGANRLGGNGVAESIVFGALAGDVIAEEVREAPRPDPDPAQAEAIVERATAPLRRDRGPDVYAALDDLRRLMWERAGVVRDAGSLAAAEAGLAELEERTAAVGVERRRETNLEWQAALNLANLLVVSRLITRAAAERRESRGAHYRSDFPAQDDRRWLVHVVLQADGAGPRVSTRPVALTRLRPAGALVEADG